MSQDQPPTNTTDDRAEPLDRSTYYQEQDQATQEWIDDLVDSWLDRAPFDQSHSAGVELLRKCAIDEHKRRRVNAAIDEGGIMNNTEDTTTTDQSTSEEHPGHLVYSRLTRDTLRTLSKLDVFEEPATDDGPELSYGEAAKRVAMKREREARSDSTSADDASERSE